MLNSKKTYRPMSNRKASAITMAGIGAMAGVYYIPQIANGVQYKGNMVVYGVTVAGLTVAYLMGKE